MAVRGGLSQIKCSNEYSICPKPHTEELLHNVEDTNFLSTLDPTTGYFQVPIWDADIHEIAFILRSGVYVFMKIPFGLSEAPTTLQKLMETVLHDFVHVYLADIIFTSRTFPEHLQNLATVFGHLAILTLKTCEV